MIEITINADRNKVTVSVDGDALKGCWGSEEFCIHTAERWQKKYEVEYITYESKLNQ